MNEWMNEKKKKSNKKKLDARIIFDQGYTSQSYLTIGKAFLFLNQW